MLNTYEVLELIKEAISTKKPLSLSRFGHGEISYAIWPKFKQWRQGFEYYRNYAGATSSIEELNKSLIHSFKKSDIVGVYDLKSEIRVDNECAKLTKYLLKKLNYKPKYVCSALVTHRMIEQHAFWDLLKQNNIALVGRRAKEASNHFQMLGIDIVDTVSLDGCEQIEEVCDKLSSNNMWDIALLSAGIPATILSPILSKKSCRVVIDFGHALDMILDGVGDFDHESLVKDWYNRK